MDTAIQRGATPLLSVYALARMARGIQGVCKPCKIYLLTPAEDFANLKREADQEMMFTAMPSAIHFDTDTRGTFFGITVTANPTSTLYLHVRGEISPDSKAAIEQMLRDFGWRNITPMPNAPGRYCVYANAKRFGEVSDISSAAIGDDRNLDRRRDLTQEEKIIAAHQAIAAYAREKKLPSPEIRATFGELDTIRANKRIEAAGNGLTPTERGAIRDAIFKEVKAHNDSLAAEPLRRALDQIRRADRGRVYQNLVGTAAERFLEVPQG